MCVSSLLSPFSSSVAGGFSVNLPRRRTFHIGRTTAAAAEHNHGPELTSDLAACVHARRIQRGVRAVHVRGIRAVLCAVPARRSRAPVHERVFGLEGRRDGDPQPLLPAHRVCKLRVVRRVSGSTRSAHSPVPARGREQRPNFAFKLTGGRSTAPHAYSNLPGRSCLGSGTLWYVPRTS